MHTVQHLALFDVGMGELLLILIVGLLLFGGRLPEVARTLGRTLGDFKRSADRITKDFRYNVDEQSFRRPPPLTPESQSLPREGDAAEPVDGEVAESSGGDAEEPDPPKDSGK